MLGLLFSTLLISQQPEFYPIEVPAGEDLELSIEDFPSDLDHLDLDEVILGKDSKLKIPSFVSVRIRKLIAKEGAKIEMIQNSSGGDGDYGVDGGHGANSTFFVDHISGHVVIAARGGKGGDGRDGRNGQKGVAGGKGQNAKRIFWFYFGYGKRGQTGGPGEDGDDGEDAGYGGDGGNLKVFYKTKDLRSNIFLDASGGEGGRGGKAGLGGLGGAGGPGGKGIRRGPQGHMGANGKNGRPGRPGEPGSPGAVSIYQVEKNLYRCLVEFELIKNDITAEEWQECLSR